MYGAMSLAYVMACVHLVFAICISMTARNGVALSVAVVVAVASVLPVVVAVMGSTVNMAAAMATATTSLGGNHIGHCVTAQSCVQGLWLKLEVNPASDTNAVDTARCRLRGGVDRHSPSSSVHDQ